jgi:hypothetical protein
VRSLAALRIALGGLLLVDLGDRARYLDVNYTDQGVLPREALGTTLSLHALGGGIAFEACLFAVAALYAPDAGRLPRAGPVVTAQRCRRTASCCSSSALRSASCAWAYCALIRSAWRKWMVASASRPCMASATPRP